MEVSVVVQVEALMDHREVEAEEVALGHDERVLDETGDSRRSSYHPSVKKPNGQLHRLLLMYKKIQQ